MSRTKSEFGQGLVYNLVLFANHLSNDQAGYIQHIAFVMKQPKEKQAIILSANPPSNLEYGKVMDFPKFWFREIVPIYGTVEKAFSSQIETWANGATDHLYDIQVPKGKEKTKLGRAIARLRSRGLSMGHGFLEKKVYTYKDFTYLRELTKKIAVMLDQELGVPVRRGEYE